MSLKQTLQMLVLGADACFGGPHRVGPPVGKKDDFTIGGVLLSAGPAGDLDQGVLVIKIVVALEDDDLQVLDRHPAFKDRGRHKIEKTALLEGSDDVGPVRTLGMDAGTSGNKTGDDPKDALTDHDRRNEDEDGLMGLAEFLELLKEDDVFERSKRHDGLRNRHGMMVEAGIKTKQSLARSLIFLDQGVRGRRRHQDVMPAERPKKEGREKIVALIGKSIDLIKDQKIEESRIAIELMGRQDDDVTGQLLGVTPIDERDALVGEGLLDPGSELDDDIAPRHGEGDVVPLAQGKRHDGVDELRLAGAADGVDERIDAVLVICQHFCGDLGLFLRQGVVKTADDSAGPSYLKGSLRSVHVHTAPAIRPAV